MAKLKLLKGIELYFTSKKLSDDYNSINITIPNLFHNFMFNFYDFGKENIREFIYWLKKVIDSQFTIEDEYQDLDNYFRMCVKEKNITLELELNIWGEMEENYLHFESIEKENLIAFYQELVNEFIKEIPELKELIVEAEKHYSYASILLDLKKYSRNVWYLSNENLSEGDYVLVYFTDCLKMGKVTAIQDFSASSLPCPYGATKPIIKNITKEELKKGFYSKLILSAFSNIKVYIDYCSVHYYYYPIKEQKSRKKSDVIEKYGYILIDTRLCNVNTTITLKALDYPYSYHLGENDQTDGCYLLFSQNDQSMVAFGFNKSKAFSNYCDYSILEDGIKLIHHTDYVIASVVWLNFKDNSYNEEQKIQKIQDISQQLIVKLPEDIIAQFIKYLSYI